MQIGAALRPLDDFRSTLALVKLFHQIRPHIVYLHPSKAGALGHVRRSRVEGEHSLQVSAPKLSKLFISLAA